MKKQITQSIEIPEGVVCTYANGILVCKKDQSEVKRKVQIPEVGVSLKGNLLTLDCKKGNKSKYKIIMSFMAHIRNLFTGLNEKFVYKLEACNVHFPMTLKSDGKKLVINNFLGEKTPREAKILPNVDVEIKGQEITITSHDKESAGQTAANFEKAGKVRKKDRRIFQDGIFITQKPRREL